MEATAPSLSPAQRRQIFRITIGVVVLFFAFRWMPTGTNLAHGDFRLEGDNVLEFCDPAAPQFLPVTTARSPVELTVSPLSVSPGQLTEFTFRLETSTGKAIGPVDLLVAHTRKLHLMVVDPSLTDYQHIHPTPGEVPGEWQVSFAPKYAGLYRVFADFTPTATARGLYASVDIQVPGAPESLYHEPAMTANLGDYRFELKVEGDVIRARDPANLTLQIRHDEGAPVELGEVMGAFAHLVAFDENRSGFAHLHPMETDLENRPDPILPELHFNITIPQSGLFVIWAQMVLDGEERFVPFWFEVEP
ncbi:MAG: hypothetical protein SynsKO_02520 [Synoicihabitans sp.]